MLIDSAFQLQKFFIESRATFSDYEEITIFCENEIFADLKCFTLANNARINLIIFLKGSAETAKSSSESVEIILEKGSSLKFLFINLDVDFHLNLQTKIIGENAKAEIYSFFHGKTVSKCQIKSEIRHLAGNSKSNQVFKSILQNECRFDLQLLTEISERGRGTEAVQKSQNLILSDLCKLVVKPNLKIFNQDVICKHGVTSTGLNDGEFFYLQSRGITKIQAEKLLTEGFGREVIQQAELLLPTLKKLF